MPATNLDEGMQLWSLYMAEPSTPQVATLVCRLFTNSWDLDQTFTIADFIETTDSGLGDFNPPGPSSIYTVGGITTVVFPQVALSASGGSTLPIYGAVLYDQDNNVALFGQLFPSPLPPPVAAQQVLINISFQFGSVNAS